MTSTNSVATSAKVAIEEEEEASKAFGLLLRRPQGLVIPAKGVQQVGVSFAPERLGEYSAAVQLRSAVAGRNLLWYFPLCGMAESANAQRIARLVTPCKSSMLRDAEVPLKGLRRADLLPNDDGPQLSDFSFELIIDPKYQAQLGRALRILPKGDYQHTLATHPCNTPFEHTLVTRPERPSYQSTNTPSHTNTHYQ